MTKSGVASPAYLHRVISRGICPVDHHHAAVLVVVVVGNILAVKGLYVERGQRGQLLVMVLSRCMVSRQAQAQECQTHGCAWLPRCCAACLPVLVSGHEWVNSCVMMGLPDVFGSLGVVIYLLGTIFQIVHIELTRLVVEHALEAQIVGFIGLHGFAHDDSSHDNGIGTCHC